MSRWKAAALVAAVLVVSAVAAGGMGAGVATALMRTVANDRPAPEPVVDESYVLPSDVLGEDREIQVHLPADYAGAPESTYPLLVVLDGAGQSEHTAESADLVARMGLGPQTVVVGVENTTGTRDRVLTPPDLADDAQGDRFLAFLETELLPDLERRYRLAEPRLLAGHSRGGLFATYALAERPDLFDGVFAFSPSSQVGSEAFLARLNRALADLPAPERFYYTSLGDAEGSTIEDGFERLAETLERSAPPSLRWRAERTGHAGHGATPRLATPVALHAFWSGRAWAPADTVRSAAS